MLRPLLICLFAFTTTPWSLAQNEADYVGHWEGKIDTAEIEFNVDLAFDDGNWSGDISIPAQGLTDRELVSLSLKDGVLTFEIQGIPGKPTFKGRLAEDKKTIAGDFQQGGAALTFSMQRAAGDEAKTKKHLDGLSEEIEKLRAAFEAPGASVAIVQRGKVVLAEGFGVRSLETRKPVTEKTLFAIGSSSKAFTTFGLGTLVDEGKLDWNKPVREYLKDFRLAEEEVAARLTVKDMVTHRSGMPRHDLIWYNRHDLDLEGIARSLEHLELNADLRESFQYNNLMFATAGYVASKIDGRSWPELTRARVTEPLGMKSTVFSVAEMKKAKDRAAPHDERDDKLVEIPYREIANVGPAGSINSNAEDMARWLLVHLGRGEIDGKRIIGSSTLREICSPQMAMPTLPDRPEFATTSYGMGWFIDGYRGQLRLHHGGNIDGFSALVTFFPFEDLGVVVLTNQNASALPEMVTRLVADRFFDLDVRDWSKNALKAKGKVASLMKKSKDLEGGAQVKDTKPAQALEAYVGGYRHPAYGLVEVGLAASGDHLTVAMNGLKAPLEHWHYETFRCGKDADDPALEGVKIQFATSMSGQIESLRSSLEPMVKPIVFDRQAAKELSDPTYLARFAGSYSLAGQTVRVALKGKTLTLTVPGQPTYTLVPSRDDSFKLKGLTGYSVAFKSEGGKVMEAVFTQPQGMFAAKRDVEEGKAEKVKGEEGR